MQKRLFSLACVVLFCATLLVGCVHPAASTSVSNTATVQDSSMDGWEKYTETWFDVFDTVTTVIGYAPSQQEWDTQIQALHDDLVAYHQLYDIYNHYDGITNLYDVNKQAGSGTVAVDSRIIDLLTEAKEMYNTTQGKLNVAFGAVLTIWHDYREAGLDDPETAQLPPMEELQAAYQHCNIDDLILDPQAGTVAFADPELLLDVGSVGKGYAVEMVARAAEERGLTSAILSVGGNLRSIGHKPDGSQWSGGIQDPWASVGQAMNTAPYLAAVLLEDESLVTSGDYQRYYTVDGKRYHHLIDPDTLMPADYFSAVAVLTPDSGLADCLSTGLFCLPLEEGQALVESLDGIEAMWMLKDGSVVYSSGFESHLKNTEQ